MLYFKRILFSAVFDRSNSKVTFTASTERGVDIEEVAHNTPEKIIKVSVDPATGIQPFHCRRMAYKLGLRMSSQNK